MRRLRCGAFDEFAWAKTRVWSTGLHSCTRSCNRSSAASSHHTELYVLLENLHDRVATTSERPGLARSLSGRDEDSGELTLFVLLRILIVLLNHGFASCLDDLNRYSESDCALPHLPHPHLPPEPVSASCSILFPRLQFGLAPSS